MDIPITNPHLSANLEDNSKVDESFQQQGTTVNIGNGGTYNQNSGNKHEISRGFATAISILCDIAIVMFMFWGFTRMYDRFSNKFDAMDAKNQMMQVQMENTHKNMDDRYSSLVERSNKIHQEIMDKAKEGTIWLLRDDLIKTIDFHEATKTITQKQFKRIKDEYEYYTSIGGNHDVKERFDNFYIEIFGTGKIKMVESDNYAKNAER